MLHAVYALGRKVERQPDLLSIGGWVVIGHRPARLRSVCSCCPHVHQQGRGKIEWWWWVQCNNPFCPPTPLSPPCQRCALPPLPPPTTDRWWLVTVQTSPAYAATGQTGFGARGAAATFKGRAPPTDRATTNSNTQHIIAVWITTLDAAPSQYPGAGVRELTACCGV